MTEKHDDKKLISAIEYATRSLPEPAPVFLYRSRVYALGDELSTGGAESATRGRGSDSAQLSCRDCICVKRAPVLDAELRAVVEESLGDRERLSVPSFGTIVDLQLAMVEYPLIVGSAAELAWHVAETNALRQVRPDAPTAARARLLSETRSHAVQELRGWNNPVSDLLPSALEERRIPSGPTDLLGKCEGKSIDRLTDDEWEEFAIRALWQICCDGIRVLPSVTPESECVRHRGVKTDHRRELVEPDAHARLLFIVETAREAILQVIEENDDIKMLCRAGLVTFAVLHPGSGELAVLGDGVFHRCQPQNPHPHPG